MTEHGAGQGSIVLARMIQRSREPLSPLEPLVPPRFAPSGDGSAFGVDPGEPDALVLAAPVTEAAALGGGASAAEASRSGASENRFPRHRQRPRIGRTPGTAAEESTSRPQGVSGDFVGETQPPIHPQTSGMPGSLTELAHAGSAGEGAAEEPGSAAAGQAKHAAAMIGALAAQWVLQAQQTLEAQQSSESLGTPRSQLDVAGGMTGESLAAGQLLDGTGAGRADRVHAAEVRRGREALVLEEGPAGDAPAARGLHGDSPEITISIGHIEVRAAPEHRAQPAQHRPRPPSRPQLTLADFLDERGNGRR